MLTVTLAAEGIADIAVLSRLAIDHKLAVAHQYMTGGKSKLDGRLTGFNNAARFGVWLVLRDQNSEADCPGDIARRLLPKPAKLMCFRLVVRAIESWFLADENFCSGVLGLPARFLAIPPESLPAPKTHFLSALANSGKRSIREQMVRSNRRGLLEAGPLYNDNLSRFAQDKWSPSRAAKKSASLQRAIRRIRDLAEGAVAN